MRPPDQADRQDRRAPCRRTGPRGPARGSSRPPAAGRRGGSRESIIHRLGVACAKVRYSRAGSAGRLGSRSSMPDADPSLQSELAVAAAVTLRRGWPRIGSQSRSRLSQPLLASSVPSGWNEAPCPCCRTPPMVARRMPVTASQRSIVPSTQTVASVRPSGLQARIGSGLAAGTPGRPAGLRLEDPAGLRAVCTVDGRDRVAVGDDRRPGPVLSGPARTSRPVARSYSRSCPGSAHKEPPAIRAERGVPPSGARDDHRQRAPIDVPDLQGPARDIVGDQVAAVGAELEEEGVAIAPASGSGRSRGRQGCGEPRPSRRGTAAPSGSCRGRRSADDPRRPDEERAGRLEVGQGQAGDRLVAQPVEVGRPTA